MAKAIAYNLHIDSSSICITRSTRSIRILLRRCTRAVVVVALAAFIVVVPR